MLGRDELRASSTALAVILVFVFAQSASAIVSGQSAWSSTISGTVRCGGGCSAVGLIYDDPIQSGGMILAHMTMALDPSTGVPRPDLPTTDSSTTFTASAHGHYELQVQPGIFDLYVNATGYQFALFASGVTVRASQNVTSDAFVTSAVTTTTSVVATSTFTVAPVLPIPGFPVESLLLGLLLGLSGLALQRRLGKRGRVSSL